MLDRYLLHTLIPPFALALALLGCLMSTGFVLFGLIEESARFQYPMSLVLNVFLLRLPEMLYYTLPMATLMGAMLAVSRLASDHEWLSLRLLGLSLWRLLLPFVGFACLTTLGSIVLNETLVPSGNAWARTLLAAAQRGDLKLPYQQSHVLFRETDEQGLKHLIYARESRDGILYDVVIQRFEVQQLRVIIQAKQALLENGVWQLKQGRSLYLQPDTSPTQFLFRLYTLPLSAALPGVLQERRQPQEMNAKELRQHIGALEQLGQDATALRVRWHQRFALPAAALPFVVLGVVLGARTVRSRSQSLGFSLLLVFGYYLIMSLGTALGDSHTLPALWAAWLPHVILFPLLLVLVQWRNQRG